MNTNCLKGMKCPECGSESPFNIVCFVMMDVSDGGCDGITDGDADWNDDSYCQCRNCLHEGEAGDFKIEMVVCEECGESFPAENARSYRGDPDLHICEECAARPCTACEGRGFVLVNVGMGHENLQIQRCDTCDKFKCDNEAVEAAFNLASKSEE